MAKYITLEMLKQFLTNCDSRFVSKTDYSTDKNGNSSNLGEINKKIDNINSDMSTNTQNIALNAKEIATNKKNINTNISNISQNTTKLSIHEANIENINKLLEHKLNGKIINIIGDDNVKGENLTNFSSLISQITNCTINNYGINGSTIGRTGIEPMCDRVGSMSGNGDVIIIAGGTNDALSSYTFDEGDISTENPSLFYGSYKALLKNIIEKYNKSGVAIITVTPVKCISDSIDSARLKRITEIIKEVSEYYSIPCLDLYNLSGISPVLETQKTKFFKDEIFLNNEGHAKIAPIILNFIEQFI